MKMWRLLAGATVALAIGATDTQAQAIGVQVSYADDFDLGVGARVELGLPNLLTSTGPLANTFLIGTFDYFFPDCADGGSDDIDCSYMEFNGNLAVPVGSSSLRPYAGAGLNVARAKVDFFGESESETEIGLNVLGGLRFMVGGLSAYGEARYELGGGEQLVFTVGALVGGAR